MADDPVRLPIDFGDGPRNAQEMRSRIDELKDEVVELQSAYERGNVTYSRYQDLLRQIGSEMRSLALAAEREERDRSRSSARQEIDAERSTTRTQRVAEATERGAERKARAEEEAARRASTAQERAFQAIAREMDRLDAATDAAAHGRGGRGGMVGFGQAMLQAGRGVQDFQAAGLMGVVNNVEGLALALGLGNGLAGVATLALVGLQVLRPMLAGTGEDAADATDQVGRLNQKIEELEKKPIKLRADYEALAVARKEVELLQRAKDALDKAMSTQSQDESESGRAVGEILATPETRDFVEAVRKARVRETQDADPLIQSLRQTIAEAAEDVKRAEAAYREAETKGFDPNLLLSYQADVSRFKAEQRDRQQALDQALEKVKTEARSAIDQAVQDATGGVGRAQGAGQSALQDLFRDRGAAGAGIAEAIAGAAPDRMPARRAAEEAEKAAKQAADQAAREAQQEADREWEEVTSAPERTGKQAAANLARRRQQADRQAREDAQAAKQAAAANAGAFAPQVQDALIGNDWAQAGGGGIPDAALADRLRSQVQRGLAGKPGVTEDNAFTVATAIIRDLQEQHERELAELRSFGMNQAQALMALRADLLRQQQQAWRMGRMQPLAPTNLSRRP